MALQTKEKRPRESLLRMEFAHAIELINKDLPEEKRLKFLHWDLNKYSRKCVCPVPLLIIFGYFSMLLIWP